MIDSAEISVVIQGPIYDSYTAKVCKSVRKVLPNSEIILSTWENSNVQNLEYDKLILSKDPGNFTFVLPRIMDNGSDLYPMNINRQIVSTQNGLKAATRKYVCKLRSDTLLMSCDFLDQFSKYNGKINTPYSKYLTHRVITLPAANPRIEIPCPYYLCDWFFFGFKEDISCIWSLPLVEPKELQGATRDGNYYMVNNFSNEQYIWLRFIEKVFSCTKCENGYQLCDSLIKSAEESYGNCTIFMNVKQVRIYSQKVRDTGYGAPSYRSNAGIYTISDWKRMYKSSLGLNHFIISNPVEGILYKMISFLRRSKIKVAVKNLFYS